MAYLRHGGIATSELEKPGSYAVGAGGLPGPRQAALGLRLVSISMALYSLALLSALYLY
jgi:hypothetical protein